MLDEIRRGNEDAMLEAGTTRDSSFIGPLRQQLTTKHSDSARRALARLGDSTAQQSLWCAAVGQIANDDYISSFEYVGGWFGISGLRVFLTPEGEQRWNELEKKRVEKEGASDYIPESPHYLALKALAKLLPDSPATKVFGGLLLKPGLAGQMQTWILEHQAELSELEPTGDGIDFSPKACKNGTQTKSEH